jgi:hypothetical protein
MIYSPDAFVATYGRLFQGCAMSNIQRAEKTETRAKDIKTVKTELVLIVYLHYTKKAQTIWFFFLCFETELIVILFSPFLPLPNKTQTLDSWV